MESHGPLSARSSSIVLSTTTITAIALELCVLSHPPPSVAAATLLSPLNRPLPPLAHAVHAMIHDPVCLLITSSSSTPSPDGSGSDVNDEEKEDPPRYITTRAFCLASTDFFGRRPVGTTSNHQHQNAGDDTVLTQLPESVGVFPSFDPISRWLMYHGPRGAYIIDTTAASATGGGEQQEQGLFLLLPWQPGEKGIITSNHGAIVTTTTTSSSLSVSGQQQPPPAVQTSSHVFLSPKRDAVIFHSESASGGVAAASEASPLPPFTPEAPPDSATTLLSSRFSLEGSLRATAMCPTLDGRLIIAFRDRLCVYDPSLKSVLDLTRRAVALDEFRVTAMSLLPRDCQSSSSRTGTEGGNELVLAGFTHDESPYGDRTSVLLFLQSSPEYSLIHDYDFNHNDEGGRIEQKEEDGPSKPLPPSRIPRADTKALVVFGTRSLGFVGVAVLPKPKPNKTSSSSNSLTSSYVDYIESFATKPRSRSATPVPVSTAGALSQKGPTHSGSTTTYAAESDWMLALTGEPNQVFLVEMPPADFRSGLVATVLMKLNVAQNLGLAVCPLSVVKAVRRRGHTSHSCGSTAEADEEEARK